MMSRIKGNHSEDEACLILKKLGFEIINRNYFTYYGEIDIIAQKTKVIHIIEVKSTYGEYNPAENFHKVKLGRLITSTKIYCYKERISIDSIQIDLLLINKQKRVAQLIEHANLFFH